MTRICSQTSGFLWPKVNTEGGLYGLRQVSETNNDDLSFYENSDSGPSIRFTLGPSFCLTGLNGFPKICGRNKFRAGLRRSHLTRLPVVSQPPSFLEEQTGENIFLSSMGCYCGAHANVHGAVAPNTWRIQKSAAATAQLFQVRGRYSWPAMANRGPREGSTCYCGAGLKQGETPQKNLLMLLPCGVRRFASAAATSRVTSAKVLAHSMDALNLRESVWRADEWKPKPNASQGILPVGQAPSTANQKVRATPDRETRPVSSLGVCV